MSLWSGGATGEPGLWGVATAWLAPKAPPIRKSSRGRGESDETRAQTILIGDPCPRDGCTVYWPRWRDGHPRCKLCALDESLAQLTREGRLTHALRKGKRYQKPHQRRRFIRGWLYEPLGLED
jgi:hypothetical protein